MITDLETNRETNTALPVVFLCQEAGWLKWVYKLGCVHPTEAYLGRHNPSHVNIAHLYILYVGIPQTAGVARGHVEGRS